MCLENAQKNEPGNNQNRFSDDVHKTAIYLYIRGGRKLYEFFTLNLNFPSIKTVKRKMLQYRKKLHEGHLYFDELAEYLDFKGYPREVSINEDGTKITEIAEYDAVEKVIQGLISPFNKRTGMTKERNFPALSAVQILQAIKNNPKASYVQVILAKPNFAGWCKKKQNQK